MKRHILITGGSSGIGAGIAQIAASYDYKITICGLESEDEMTANITSLDEAGAGSVSYYQCDLTDGMAARDFIKQAAAAMGHLDVLVNNAGMQHVSPIDEFDSAAWDKVIALNLSAAFHTSAAALPMMRAQNWGRIINIASVHGLVASVNKAAYVASKHGLIGLTKTIALETANSQITCNAICPGWVKTPLVEAQITARASASGQSVEDEARQLVSEKQPKADFVTPEQIGEMVHYLASDKADMITGAQMVMDGGWTAQ